jgi:hypothetical protein
MGLIMACIGSTCLALTPVADQEKLRLGRDAGAINSAFFADQSGQPQGGIIIASTAQNNSHKLQGLAHNLAEYGWTSLIIELPMISPTQDPDDPAAQPADTESAQMTDAEYLALAIEFMQAEKGQFNLVLLALNASWPRLSPTIGANQKTNLKLQGFILLDVDVATKLDQLPKGVPTLDIANQRTTPVDFDDRKRQAKHYRLTKYQQVNLGPAARLYSLAESRFTRRVRGWLRTNVQGMELGK